MAVYFSAFEFHVLGIILLIYKNFFSVLQLFPFQAYFSCFMNIISSQISFHLFIKYLKKLLVTELFLFL